MANNARIEEIALDKYRNVIVERQVIVIEPDSDMGASPIIAHIDQQRPIGSTAKPTVGTSKSHISHVVLDSTCENMAAYHLELSPYALSYAKNDRLNFDIDYEWHGKPHKYVPDYLVRVGGGDRAPIMVILEITGFEDEQDRATRTAAIRWCTAVNNHGGFGRWQHFQTKKPTALAKELEKFHHLPREATADDSDV